MDSRKIVYRETALVAVGERHTVAVNKDGSVVAIGDDSAGQCGVSDWKLW